MKARYLMLFLISVLIFNSVGCVKPETIKVQYVVVAHKSIGWAYPKVTVSFNNHSKRKTDTIYNLDLKRGTDEVFRDLEEPISFSPEGNWYGEILATYNHIPKNEPLAIAVISENKIDSLCVFIIVDDIIWKDDFISICPKEDCAADASGVYGQ